MNLTEIIDNALCEDLGDGDHSSLASLSPQLVRKAKITAKEDGILAGVEVAKQVAERVDKSLKVDIRIADGTPIRKGDVVMTIEGSAISLLSAERTMLNFMQRMSGIATQTNAIVKLLEGTHTRLLDTRKTTPGFRLVEKMAVKIGGGYNHRFGLFDMIMLKDNHIDYAGGIRQAVEATHRYLKEKNLNLKIEVETRSLDDVREVMQVGGVDRIMLDNFAPEMIVEALKIIDGKYETEASGGITLTNIRAYAETGVDFISVGALTHHIKSIDLSMTAM
ncbi:MAG: carboxylating nicotinate-nucleotide diphosphorylase [Bacteroidales bacterium]|nr:carboxylating nicotinate-nucleotide diphosphorylase [Bacteroidales bacterium]